MSDKGEMDFEPFTPHYEWQPCTPAEHQVMLNKMLDDNAYQIAYEIQAREQMRDRISKFLGRRVEKHEWP